MTQYDFGVMRMLRRSFWLGGVAVLVLGATATLAYEADRRDDVAVLRARELSRLGRDAYILALDREDRVRGYLLDRDSSAAGADAGERTALFAKLDSLRRLDSLVGVRALTPVEDSVVRDVHRSLSLWDSVFVAGVFSGAPDR
ncbi:MAG TPA: hypothetical protein VHV78_07825, partial [Gemmatimonadaceae bacterium]|nr:hypothetical protein [Gemmatimonadaceae bacterium]